VIKPATPLSQDVCSGSADFLSQLTLRRLARSFANISMPPYGICHFASPAGIRMR